MQRVERSIRVHAPIDGVYRMWRNFETFPQFMEHVESVHVTDPEGKRSHWRLRGPLGMNIEYDAALTEDVSNKEIGWRSLDGNLGNSGTVTFAELDDETEVHVFLQWYDPPGGPIGEALAHILQNPEKMLDEDLRRFKKVIEEPGRVEQARVA